MGEAAESILAMEAASPLSDGLPEGRETASERLISGFRHEEGAMKGLKMVKLSIIALALGTFGVPGAWAAGPYRGEGHLITAGDAFTWSDVASMAPGAKIAVIEGPLNEAVPFIFRLKLPANYKIAPHWHPAYERVTVISGTLYFAAGDRFAPEKATALPAGAVAIMPPKMPMYGFTKEETVIQVHGTGPWGIEYVNPADDPRKK